MKIIFSAGFKPPLPIVNSERAGDRLHRVVAVAGQDAQIELKTGEHPHYLSRVGPQFLADRDGGRATAVDKIDMRGARLMRGGLRDAAKFGAAQPRFDAAERGAHALPRLFGGAS
jgi:hypothetical protein